MWVTPGALDAVRDISNYYITQWDSENLFRYSIHREPRAPKYFCFSHSSACTMRFKVIRKFINTPSHFKIKANDVFWRVLLIEFQRRKKVRYRADAVYKVAVLPSPHPRQLRRITLFYFTEKYMFHRVNSSVRPERVLSHSPVWFIIPK